MDVNEATVSYVIVNDQADLESFSMNEIDEEKLLEGLVQKHNAERIAKNWKPLASEYLALTGQNLNEEELNSKWRQIKAKNVENKALENSIANVLKEGQNFEIKQFKDSDGKMSTTIVLLNDDFQDEQLEQQDANEEERNDLISLALNASGVQVSSTQIHEVSYDESTQEYEQLAHEILYGDVDAKIAKKRLKFDRKLRAENATFHKSKAEILKQIEGHKRRYQEQQVDIFKLEQELKAKELQLKKVLLQQENKS